MIEHDFFGAIETDATGGLYWSETVEVGDQAVDVSLSAPGGVSLAPDALDNAAGVISSLEGLDLRAREAMLSDVDDRNSDVTQFIEQTVEETGESLVDLLVDHSGDNDVDIIRSLQLIRVAVSPHQAGESAQFASFEFAFDPDNSDLALVVYLSMRGESVGIELLT
jgi:adhesin HecA-like repeat protein